VTGFYRVQRGAVSEVEDSFTIILQYDGPQKELLVTVKTAVITPMAQQLKYWVRGTKGSYIKWQQRSTCPQEEQIDQGMSASDPKFGTEPDHLRGTLTTYEEFDGSLQKLDKETNKYTGQVPTMAGRWVGLYENVAHAILGKAELAVRAVDVRDCLRILELARESHEKGVTIAWK
jgi:predicted dehydrogenase